MPVDPSDPTPTPPPVSPTDTTAPSISITTPSSGATVSNSVSLAVTTSDDVGVVAVQYKVDGLNVGEEAAAPFTGVWNTSSLPDGTYSLTATARDAAGNTKTSSPISVTVHNTQVNSAPVLTAIANPTLTETSSLSLTLVATDSDGDPLVYSATNLPSGSTFNTSSHVFSWTPRVSQAGSYTVTFSVTDGKNPAVSQTVTITVVALPVVTTNDADHDSVTDSLDVCANTPSGLTVNLLGCPLPKTTEFPNLTNLSSVDLRAVTSFDIGNTYGKIAYPAASLPYTLIRNNTRLDIDASLDITQGKVTLDSTTLPELNRPAIISLYNMKLSKPAIKKNGVVCSTCTLISYDSGTKVLTFSAPGFSTYEIVEDSSAGSSSGGKSSKTGVFTPTNSLKTTLPVNATREQLITYIKARIAELMTELNAQLIKEGKSPVTAPTTSVFTKDLYLNITDPQVFQLQRFLNTHGFPVGTNVGSYGKEVNTFGPVTESTLKKFQTANGIKATGYFGVETRGRVNAMK
jgi:hypothetical protein